MGIDIIFGGQFGSEGKGLLASYLARKYDYNIATTDAGPNAGHTAVIKGKKVVTFHLPMAGVLTGGCLLYLNGGSIINALVLHEEINSLKEFNVENRLRIHPHAVVIEEQDIETEQTPGSSMHKISSTQKGVGAAAARKVMREAKVARQEPRLKDFMIRPLDMQAMMASRRCNTIVEVAQGFSLGVNAGFYPFTTHRSCTPAQGLMNAGIPTNLRHTIYAVIRANPIRVGNLPGSTSGDCYPDQQETTWEKLGLEPQYTTVTKRLRRVFTFSERQINDMVLTCRPHVILINFAQTINEHYMNDIRTAILRAYTKYGWEMPRILLGRGPEPGDVMEGHPL